MNKTLIVYYSNTGSNKYLAKKISENLNCDIEAIKPRLNVFFFLMMFSLFKRSFGIKKLNHNVSEYDHIILCGPIWMGKLISPLRDFIKKYGRSIKKPYFISCCGSGYAVKDEKFGHAIVFNIVKEMLWGNCIHCEAFPIGLVLPDDKQKNSDAIMKTRLSDNNFTGEIQQRFENFIQKITEAQISKE